MDYFHHLQEWNINFCMKFRNLLYLIILFTSCSTKVEVTDVVDDNDSIINTGLKEDTPILLIPIQENYQRIDAIDKWDSIIERETHETVEGGYINFYYKNAILEKIVRRNFAETGNVLSEYYFFDDKISFAYDKIYQYNVPYFIDSRFYIETGLEGEVFDIEKTRYVEFQNYFKGDSLVKSDCNLENKLSKEDETLQKFYIESTKIFIQLF